VKVVLVVSSSGVTHFKAPSPGLFFALCKGCYPLAYSGGTVYDWSEVVGEKRQGLGLEPVLWEGSGTPDEAAKLAPLTRKADDAKGTGIGLMRPKFP
jgi:hypothetical protein